MSTLKNILKHSVRILISVLFTCTSTVSCAKCSNPDNSEPNSFGESSADDINVSDSELLESINQKISVDQDTLTLRNVYINACVGNYNNSKYFDAEKFCQLVLFDDSIAIIPFSPKSLKPSVCIYKIPTKIKNSINSLTEQINSVKNPLLRSFTIPYKVYGSVSIYSNIQTEAINADIFGELVDSLYTILCKLPYEFEKRKPNVFYQNRILEICPIPSEERCNTKDTKLNISANYGADLIFVEGDSIAYYNFQRRKQSAKLSSNDRDLIFKLFKESGIFVYNTISPNVLYEMVNDYSVIINGIVLFLCQYPASGTMDLSETVFLIKDRYIQDMYILYKIAIKYFPNLYQHFTLENNGKRLIYQ